MTDANARLRDLVDRSGYAFNMAVAETIRRSFNSGQQKWECTATELPWSRRTSEDGGFIDVVIRRGDRAVGMIECKKVNNGDELVFLTRHDANENEIECRLEVYVDQQPYEAPNSGYALTRADDRFVTVNCTMATGSPESAFCAATKSEPGSAGKPRVKSANLNVDDIASLLLQSCEGAMNDWRIEQHDEVVCLPIIVTNASIYTCAFDAAAVNLADGDLPAGAEFKPRPFVRFRKAFKQTAGLDPHPAPVLEAAAGNGERTVFVVEARHLVTFLANLRTLYRPHDRGQRLMVSSD